MRVGFGLFVLDTETRELLRQGQPVHLTPKAFNLLQILLAERPKAVAKRVLMERLWPDVYVVETNLASLMAELREALGDSAREPLFLRTVQRFGYAFCGEVHEERRTTSAPPGTIHHRLVLGTREVVLAEGENLLGRDPEAAVLLDHASVSRRHARIIVSGASATLEDLDSKNGTFIRGKPLSGPTELAEGDDLRLGSVKLTYRFCATPPSTETVRHP
jgi:DNA-binding winged helix-turn-helix (wHTH) protein